MTRSSSSAWSSGRPAPSSVQLARGLSLLVSLLLVAGLTLVGPPASATDSLSTPRISPLVKGGFGDSGNSYSWSMAWFNGKLYVGTGRMQLCVENATLDFYYPGRGYYVQHPEPEMTCPADKWDMDLRAEIWQFTPKTNTWARVYQSPTVPNPRAPGKDIAVDLGYRGMTVYHGALYVGAVSPDEFVPELATSNPPRLLRTTDGTHFDPVNADPGVISTVSGSQRPMGFRALTSFHGKLFVTASAGLTGDGVLMEVSGLDGPRPRFRQVSPSSLQIFEIQPFHNRLYIGTGSAQAGYGVYSSDRPAANAGWQPVITGGAGRGAAITSVVSMSVYRGKLYVGASGWYSTLFPASELGRISRDGRWELVVGNPRYVDGSLRWPASGLFDGFGNIFNAHFWRMSSSGGGLFLGTNDWSWALRKFPLLDGLLRSGYGFDLYGTCDGTTWSAQTTNAFGDGLYNFGLRTMASTPEGFFLGSANHVQGTAVWREAGAACRQPGSISSRTGAALDARPQASTTEGPNAGPTPDAAAPPPASAGATSASCGSVVSWQPSPGATRYVVSRSADTTIRGAALEPPPRLPGGFSLPSAPAAVSSPTAAIPVPAPYGRVAVTTQTSYVDRSAKPGVHYQYKITPENGSSAGPASTVVGQTPPTTTSQVRSQIASLAADAQLSDTKARGLKTLLTAVDKAPQVASVQATALRSLGEAVKTSGASSTAVADLGDAVSSLARSIVAARQGCGG